MAASSYLDLDLYFALVPQNNKFKLDKKLDFDHDGVQKDLGTIANSMDEWEGNVAEQFQLTKPEIQAIKTEFPGKLSLQTRAALEKWQEKMGPTATYRALIITFIRAGKRDYAEVVCKVLQSSASGARESDSESPKMNVDPKDPIQRYATYLYGVYKSAFMSSDKFPYLTCDTFISLALVKTEQISRSEADKFTKATLHGHVDDIVKKKEPIKLEEILKAAEGQPETKCVYMHGAPGVGKSTCVGELCRRWDKIDALKKYTLLILLRLREKRVQEARKVEDLCYHTNKELREAVAAEIEACEGKGVLFILDGFDELPASLQKSSVFVELICGTYLSHCRVLVTSRPSATANLFAVARPQVRKQVEVLGFTEECIEEYTKAIFASQPDVLADFLTYITTHPAIKSLMYIPLNCAITAETYRHNKIVNRPIPQTMTQLYTEMSLTLLQRHFCDSEDNPLAEQLPENLEDLPPQLQKSFSSLASVAFEGLERDEVVFHKLPKGCVHFGFMNSPTELYMGRQAPISHSFLHLTLQEFLAAFRISCLSPGDQKTVFEKHCETAGWDVVWRFVAGLTGFRGIGWEVVQSRRGRNEDGSLKPFLIRCLYEAQGKVDCDSVLGESKLSVLFDGRHSLTAFDCFAVGYCVANSVCMWRLNMTDNVSLGGTLVKMLQHGLQFRIMYKSTYQREHSNILGLNLKECDLNLTAFDQLSDIIPLMINLEVLYINGNLVEQGGLVKLFHALLHLKHLKILGISSINIGCADIEALSRLITPSSSLKVLKIGDHRMQTESMKLLLKTVLSPSSLTTVEFHEVKWTGHDHTLTLLEENNNLTTLELRNSSSEAISSVATALCKNTHLKVFLVYRDRLNDEIVTSMEKMLTTNQTLETLGLFGQLTLGQLLALNDALQLNNTLKIFKVPPYLPRVFSVPSRPYLPTEVDLKSLHGPTHNLSYPDLLDPRITYRIQDHWIHA